MVATQQMPSTATTRRLVPSMRLISPSSPLKRPSVTLTFSPFFQSKPGKIMSGYGLYLPLVKMGIDTGKTAHQLVEFLYLLERTLDEKE